ncbi:MAG: GAF domain-containing protein [Bacteroidia bacterium]
MKEDLILNEYITNYEEALYIQHGIRERVEHVVVSPLNAFYRSSGCIRVVNKLDDSGSTLTPGGFSDEDVARLELIAALSSNAISYLKLEKRENVLNNIPDLFQQFGPKRVFNEIAKSLINESTLYSACIIRIVDYENRYLEIKGASINSEKQGLGSIKVENGITGNTFYSDRYNIVEDLTRDPENFIYIDWAKTNRKVSMICFPLKSIEKNINYGTLSVYTDFKFRFGKEDIKYLESFAYQVSRIIEMIKDDEEQRLLKEISQDLIKEPNLEDIMLRTSQALPQITGFDKCRFFKRDGNIMRMIGPNGSVWPNISLNKKVSQKVLQNPEELVVFNDVDQSRELEEFQEHLENIRSMIVIPITSSQKELLGIIVLTSLKNREVHIRPERKAKVIQNLISKLNKDLLHTISNLFANAIERNLEREKKEEIHRELLEERHLLRTLIDKVPDLIYIKDNQHRFKLINKAQANLLGVSSLEDAKGKTDFDFFSNEDARLFHEKEEKLFRGETDTISLDENVTDKEKKQKLVFRTTKSIYTNSLGEIAGLVGIGHDITRLTYMIEDLEKSNTEAKKAFHVIKSQYEEYKKGVGRICDRLIEEYGPESKAHLYARMIAADFFVERELFVKYMSKQSLKSERAGSRQFESVFNDGFEQVIKLAPKALGENALVKLDIGALEKQSFRFDKENIQNIILSLVMNALKHKAIGTSPTIYIEAKGNYLSVKNDFEEAPQNMDELKRIIKASEYQHQGSTLFTIDKYFKENYKQDIDIDYKDNKFIVDLPLMTNMA